MKPAVVWAYAVALAASAVAWLAPEFITGLAGDAGLDALQLIGLVVWGLGALALILLASQWLSVPTAIRRSLWRQKQF
jgi:hypothetical protein